MPPKRRSPTQQRSRETVARIVDAAVSVLSDVGYDQASTNRIAAAAGVSPGTLYGYFSDKDDIVFAVIERVVEGFGEAVAPALRGAAALPERESTWMVLDAVLTAIEARAPLIETFVDRVPAERYAPQLDQLRERVSDVAFQLLAARRPGVPVADLERATWFAVRTTEHLVVRYVVLQPPIPRDAFLDELTRTVLGFSAPPA
ncbi:MAG: TetR/AcrR family transcriptional regulator [Solirubrobacteraceae bacterium]|nr:TetR/AcrR family transcriptional regulator [Solirubrobacteraceae bacterium]